MVGLQPPQALLDRRQDPPAAAVPAGRHLLVADAEFGDDRDLMTTAAECSRQGLFRYAHAVGLGGIEAGDAAVDRLLHGALELGVGDPAVSAADLPAAEADRRDLEVGVAEWSIFHAFPASAIARRLRRRVKQSAAPCPAARERPRCRAP